MDSMHQLRETLRVNVKRYDQIVGFVLRFLVGTVIFSAIMGIGFYNPAFAVIARMGFLFTGFMGVLFALLPLSASYVIMIALTAVQFSAQLEIAVIVLMGLSTLFLLFGQFSKRENALVIALLMGFYLGVPYAVPIVAGLYFGLTSIIPLAVGAFIFSYSQLVFSLASDAGAGAIGLSMDMITDMELEDVFGAFMELYQSFSLDSEPIQGWIFMTIAMFVVFVFVYIVARLPINFGKELAIGLGGLISLFAFLFVHAFVDLGTNVGMIALMSIVSTVLLLLYHYMSTGLDYNKAGRVEFSDEDYYYYVKYVPKIKTPEQRQREAAEKNQAPAQKRLTGHSFLDDDDDDDEPVPSRVASATPSRGSGRGSSQVAATSARSRYEQDRTTQRAMASSRSLMGGDKTPTPRDTDTYRPRTREEYRRDMERQARDTSAPPPRGSAGSQQSSRTPSDAGQRVSPRSMERHNPNRRS